MTRRTLPVRARWTRAGWIAAAIGGVLLTGGTVASAENRAPAPQDPAAIARWCSTEQQGALDLVRDLRRQEQALALKEQAATTRSAEIQAAQARLDARLAELTALRTAIDARLVQADAARDKEVQGLVQMVEVNRPAAVVPMFQRLEPALAIEVLDRMKRSKAGKLLAALPPDQAAALAQAMTAPIVLPTP